MTFPFLRTNLLLILALLLPGVWLQAQQSIAGRVVDAETNLPLPDASVVLSGAGKFAATGTNGRFIIDDVVPGTYTLVVSHAGYLPFETQVDSRRPEATVLVLTLSRDQTATTVTEIPTVTLDEAEAETDGAGEVANLLHANRDVFQNIAGFGWSFFRFRERGYESEQFPVYLNGVPVNDPETGIAFFGEFGGLNDVLRSRTSVVGLNPADFSFGNLGGASFIDTRASVQRKQIRASYASTNRLYRNRTMLTASTGLLPGGWAVSASVSHRWAQEGYVPGTFFDAYSYFLSADKKFGQRHALNLTVLGAQNKRGRSADSFQEMYDIAGTNYYNPLWGFQNGEKRNAQVQTNHQPTAILRYDWTPEPNTGITAAVYAQGGPNSFTRLNWINAFNPAPDFNRRLPSSLLDPGIAADWAAQLAGNEALRQIDWHALYNTNRNNFETVQNADGIAGNTVSGLRSRYIVEDQRSDSREAGGNIFVRHTANNRVTVNGGLSYQAYTGQNYKLIDDLLGGDYWLDVDFFSQFSDANFEYGNADLRIPNNVVREGDVFGYDYDEQIRTANGWVQTQYNGARFQYFVAGSLAQNNMWREGNMQSGRAPDNSLGKSERRNFTTYGAKGGIVWKANGRNYLYANGFIGTQSPRFRDIFLAPTVRNSILRRTEVANVRSVEGGYLLRAPYYRARLTGYFSEFSNETERIFASAMAVSRVLENYDFGGNAEFTGEEAFLEAPVFFGAGVLQGIGRRHAGVEAAIEAKPRPAWTLTAAGTIGQHIYTDRPELLLAFDNSTVTEVNVGTVYQKNFYVPRTPQTAGSFAVRYEGKRFWSVSATANYAANLYYDFDRLRRTTRFVESLERDNATWTEIIDQKRAPDAFTVDVFFYKSHRFARRYFVIFNLGVNNILNNQNIVLSGRDAYRNFFRNDVSDPRFYTSELTYAPGINYFASIALQIR